MPVKSFCVTIKAEMVPPIDIVNKEAAPKDIPIGTASSNKTAILINKTADIYFTSLLSVLNIFFAARSI